ncbi:hypothetical protein ACWDKQ_02455 [Saccharopolyspora sp. NPDC000995]
MKVSVSLTDEDVTFVDEYAQQKARHRGGGNRIATLSQNTLARLESALRLHLRL